MTTDVIITGLLAAKSLITLCSEVVVALLPVLGSKLAPAPELEASRSTVLNFDFSWMKKGQNNLLSLITINLHLSICFYSVQLSWQDHRYEDL